MTPGERALRMPLRMLPAMHEDVKRTAETVAPSPHYNKRGGGGARTRAVRGAAAH